MSEFNFYNPEEIKPYYDQIVPAYQSAFKGDPWEEASKCVDEQSRCIGGFSALEVGELCLTCGNCTERPAYEKEELIERFEALAASRPTAWYTEQNGLGLTSAAIAWKATPSRIAEEKYSDVPEMTDWLQGLLGDDEIIWLDEVFANKDLQPTGNLKNFGNSVIGFTKILRSPTVAYRTKEPRMLTVAKRDFGVNATILTREKRVPDRRDFVTIKLSRCN